MHQKYDDTPYYERDKPREDLGYIKPPQKEWASDVVRKAKENRSPTESPLKEWWKKEREKK